MGRNRGWSGTLSKFGEYLKFHGLEREEIAQAAEVTPSYISMLAHGKAKPGFRRALAIERWTTANVTEDGTPTGKPVPFSCTDWGF